jgi:hypothetical protein
MRTCTVETDNPNHDMPGPNGSTTGHYDGEYHWVTPIPPIGCEYRPPPPTCPQCAAHISAYEDSGGGIVMYCTGETDCEWEYTIG